MTAKRLETVSDRRRGTLLAMAMVALSLAVIAAARAGRITARDAVMVLIAGAGLLLLQRMIEAAPPPSTEMFERAFRASPAPMVICRPDGGGIVDANDAVLATFGFRREEVLGRTTVELGLWGTEARDPFRDKLLRAGRLRDETVQVATPRGRRSFLVSSELVEIGGERHALVVAQDSTEQHEVEEMFTRVFHACPASIVVSDLETGRMIDVNDAFVRISGFQRYEVVGRTAVESGVWRSPELRQRFVAAVKEHGALRDFLLEANTKSGKSCWLLVATEIVEIKGRRTLVTMSQDFTDRRAAEHGLKESEERWRRMSDAAFEGIAITHEGRMLDVNEQLARMLGYGARELVGRPVADLVAPESLEEVSTRIAAGSLGPYEHLALHKDGTRVPVEVRARIFEQGDRRLRVSAISNMTERRRLEADLRRAAQEWNECFDAMPVGLLIADAAGRVRRLNRRVLEWSGHATFAEVLGRPLGDVTRGEPWASMARLLESSGSPALRESEIRDAARGTSWRVAWSDFPPSEGDVPWTVFVIRDVTETVRLRDDLQRQETLAAVGSLVAGVAHEVRTPLFSISATLDAFEGEMPAEQDEAVRLLRAQVKRLSNLMSDLLDYGRPPNLQFERAGLEEVVRRAMALCAPLAAEAGVTVRTDCADGPTAVDRDARRLEQAFQNLIANAIQHAPRGSEVLVTVRGVRRGSRRYVDCTVEDAGPGIPPEALPRLFEPFFTRRHGGTGLGLPIVQRIVEAHGGTVTAANRASIGAVFTVALPAAPAARPERRPLSA